MAPFTYAMRFINGNADELTLLVNYEQAAAEVFRLAQLWSHIKQACARVAAQHILEDTLSLIVSSIRVDRSDCHAKSFQCVHLISLLGISV